MKSPIGENKTLVDNLYINPLIYSRDAVTMEINLNKTARQAFLRFSVSFVLILILKPPSLQLSEVGFFGMNDLFYLGYVG